MKVTLMRSMKIIGVFRDAAKAAKGSYDIIYLHDDSDKEHFNEFQVFVFMLKSQR